jgi:penicillin-binding protein 1C
MGALRGKPGLWARRLVLLACLPLLLAAPGFAVLDALFPPDFSKLGDLSADVTASDGTVLRGFLAGDGAWRARADISRIDPSFLRGLTALEDRRFLSHHGVDPVAVARAGWQLARNGRLVSGASTLTMQTARLLEPHSRDLGGKLFEMFRAVQIERRLSKPEILAAYLTLTPYGGNVEGVEAASRAWLGHRPDRLLPEETALLLALPQAPESRRPDRHAEAARIARDRALRRMENAGLISARDRREAGTAPIPTRRHDMPALAAHLAERLHVEQPGQAEIRTTISAPLQREAEALLRRKGAGLPPGQSLAAIGVEPSTGRVLFHVGGADYFNLSRAGMVDLSRAVRSPGSTLKPFIYGMGFEDRLLHPATLIHDAPHDFGGYAPGNFDGRFHGDVSLGQALQTSLNLPAVAVLDRVGPQRFAGRLQNAGARLEIPGGVPGLPIALGGLGTDLESLALLYAGLADGGLAHPLVFLADAPPSPAYPLLERASARELETLLRQVPVPRGFAPGTALASSNAARLPAFKTGTSYGYRDAWALGWRRDIAIGVWVGRPDGEPCVPCGGLLTAAPILLALYDLVPPGSLPAPPASPEPPLPEFFARAAESLPPGLRRLEPGGEELPLFRAPVSGESFAIAFPPQGAEITLAEGQGLAVTVEGGRRPLRVLLNGHIEPETGWQRDLLLSAPETGFHRLTVIDAAGRSAETGFRIRRR